MNNVVCFLGTKSSPEIASLTSYFDDDDFLILDTHSILQCEKFSIYNDVHIDGEYTNIQCYYVQSLLEHPFLSMRYRETDISEISAKFLRRYFNKFGMLSSLILIEEKRGKEIINPLRSYYSHHYKPYQIEQLRNNGLPVPETISTNCSDFIQNNIKDGKYVRKPVSGHDYVYMAENMENSDDETKLTSPHMFQEYVKGNDIRVYILDNTVIGAYKIKSRERPDHIVDYRRYESGFEEIKLSTEECNACRQAADILEMTFCAIDCRRDTSTSTFSILDCNPNPAFVPIEEDLGVRTITETLVSYINKSI